MMAQATSFDAPYDANNAVEALGGNRLHARYMPGAAEAMMATVRLFHAEDGDYAAVHALASDTIGGALASEAEIRRVDQATGASIWVMRRHGEVSGFLAPLALTLAGRNALIDGSFDPFAIDPAWVARMGEPLAGFYCWSYAGRDQVSRGALVLALRSLIDRHFPDLPFFGRGATSAGARIMGHLGFAPFDTTPHLFWRCRSVMDAAS